MSRRDSKEPENSTPGILETPSANRFRSQAKSSKKKHNRSVSFKKDQFQHLIGNEELEKSLSKIRATIRSGAKNPTKSSLKKRKPESQIAEFEILEVTENYSTEKTPSRVVKADPEVIYNLKKANETSEGEILAGMGYTIVEFTKSKKKNSSSKKDPGMDEEGKEERYLTVKRESLRPSKANSSK